MKIKRSYGKIFEQLRYFFFKICIYNGESRTNFLNFRKPFRFFIEMSSGVWEKCTKAYFFLILNQINFFNNFLILHETFSSWSREKFGQSNFTIWQFFRESHVHFFSQATFSWSRMWCQKKIFLFTKVKTENLLVHFFSTLLQSCRACISIY